MPHIKILATCPDQGTCHHDCGEGPCYRVLACAPLSAYAESWPIEVVAEHWARENQLRVDAFQAEMHARGIHVGINGTCASCHEPWPCPGSATTMGHVELPETKRTPDVDI